MAALDYDCPPEEVEREEDGGILHRILNRRGNLRQVEALWNLRIDVARSERSQERIVLSTSGAKYVPVNGNSSASRRKCQTMGTHRRDGSITFHVRAATVAVWRTRTQRVHPLGAATHDTTLTAGTTTGSSSLTEADGKRRPARSPFLRSRRQKS